MKDIIETTILCLNHFESLCSYDKDSPQEKLAAIELLLDQGNSLEEVLEDLTW